MNLKIYFQQQKASNMYIDKHYEYSDKNDFLRIGINRPSEEELRDALWKIFIGMYDFKDDVSSSLREIVSSVKIKEGFYKFNLPLNKSIVIQLCNTGHVPLPEDMDCNPLTKGEALDIKLEMMQKWKNDMYSLGAKIVRCLEVNKDFSYIDASLLWNSERKEIDSKYIYFFGQK